MLDARFSQLYFCQSLDTLQRGLFAIAELLVICPMTICNSCVADKKTRDSCLSEKGHYARIWQSAGGRRTTRFKDKDKDRNKCELECLYRRCQE